MKKTIISLLSFLILSSSFVACTAANDEMPDDKDDNIVTDDKDDDIITDDKDNDIMPDDKTDDDLVESKNYELKDYVDAVKETYGTDYSPNTMLEETEIKERLGLDSNLYDDIYAEGSILDTNADIFVAVKAKTGKTEEVKSALETYKSDLENNTAYTANIDKISNTEVYSNGDYVFLMILGADEFTDDGDNTEQFKAQAEKGKDTLDKLFK